MGKKTKRREMESRMGKRRPDEDVDPDVLAAQEAEEAELRAELRALGRLPPEEDVEGGDGGAASAVASATGSRTYDRAALESKLEDIRLDLPFRQTLAVVSELTLGQALAPAEVHDDLKRETAFYQQAQLAVAAGRRTLDAQQVPYLRPDDYYAEMVKSDGHMQRIRDSLVFEQKKMAAFEQRKRNQEQKKFGKQLQAEKAVAKAAEKRATLEAIKQIRKRRGQNNEGGAGDGAAQFDVQLEEETDRAQRAQERGGWVYDRREAAKGGSRSGDKSQRRRDKDAKWGHGGGGRKGGKSKRNNESRDDAGAYGKATGKYRGGGRTGPRTTSGGQRPGKKRRMAGRK